MTESGRKLPDTPFTLETPEGWQALQHRAKSTRDPKELEKIIAEMNRILTEREERASAGDKRPPSSARSRINQTLPPE